MLPACIVGICHPRKNNHFCHNSHPRRLQPRKRKCQIGNSLYYDYGQLEIDKRLFPRNEEGFKF